MERTALDRQPRRTWIALTTGFTAIAIAAGWTYSVVLVPWFRHTGHWWVVPEVWPPFLAGRYVASGAYGYLYQADPFFVATPLGAVAMAPVSFVADLFRLTDNYRFDVPHPTAWLVYEPYAMALCGAVFAAASLLTEELRSRAHRLGASLLQVQVAMFALVVAPAAIVYGHYEDVLAIALVLLAGRELLRGRTLPAALLLGMAVGFKQWAVLGVPILVTFTPPGARIRALASSVAVPAALVALPLAVDHSHALDALLHAPSFPALGHALPWVRGAGPLVWTWGRTLSLLAACVVAAAVRRRPRTAPVLLATLGTVFLARPFFEATTFAYYWAPGLALLYLHQIASRKSGARVLVLGTALMAIYPWHPPASLWWALEGAIVALLVTPAARELLHPAPDERMDLTDFRTDAASASTDGQPGRKSDAPRLKSVPNRAESLGVSASLRLQEGVISK